jgi:RNA polymerase sigma factor (TIGR02999 family)
MPSERAVDLFDPDVYAHLRALAARMVAERGRGELTLQPTALVHEAWMKLAGTGGYESRLHFLRTAAVAMRQVLVDEERARTADKRGGGFRRTTLTGVADDGFEVGVIELDRALARLEALDRDAAEVVLLRCFGGLTLAEAAEALGVSDRTISTRWRHARAWIVAHLADPPDAAPLAPRPRRSHTAASACCSCGWSSSAPSCAPWSSTRSTTLACGKRSPACSPPTPPTSTSTPPPGCACPSGSAPTG